MYGWLLRGRSLAQTLGSLVEEVDKGEHSNLPPEACPPRAQVKDLFCVFFRLTGGNAQLHKAQLTGGIHDLNHRLMLSFGIGSNH